jgi:hypothetical protein
VVTRVRFTRSVNLLLLVLPLLLLGFTAGALRAWATLPTHPPFRRRLLQVAWVALLLFGAPAWLVLAAVLKLW